MSCLKKGLFYITFSLTAAVVSVCAHPMHASAATIVTADILNVRSGAGTEYSRVGSVRYGNEVAIVESVTGADGYTWNHISSPVQGWVRGDYLAERSTESGTESAAPSGGTEGTVTADVLNVRSGAGTGYSRLGTIRYGAKVAVISQSGEWYQVNCTIGGANQVGYVHRDYIHVNGPIEETQPETTPETESEAETESLVETESETETESTVETESSAPTVPDQPEQPVSIKGVVNCDALNVRSSASTSGSRLGLIYQNAEVEILAQEGSWYKVNCTINGSVRTGYVHSDYITKKAVPSTPSTGDNTNTDNNTGSSTVIAHGIVNCDALNVRTGAGTSYGKLGMIYRNTKVEILAQEGSWYKVNCTIGANVQTGYVSADYITKVNPGDASGGTQTSSSYRIANFPMIYQNPELPTGCEITSLTMILRFAGYSVDKTTMASQYLPKEDYKLTVGADGKKYGPDLDYVFVGDPFKAGSGTVCGAEALVTAGNSYLSECGSSLRVKNLTGCSASELYERVSNNQPVVVLSTISMANRWAVNGWYTSSGKYVGFSRNDHASVLIGYTQNTVTIACPIYGVQTYTKTQFEKVFASRGYQAVVIE